jgi:hypothetical protein
LDTYTLTPPHQRWKQCCYDDFKKAKHLIDLTEKKIRITGVQIPTPPVGRRGALLSLVTVLAVKICV